MLLLLFINYKNMQELLQQYKEIEKYAHVSFDDIMNKVSQEIAELVEAKVLQNDEEIHKEASDVLINLLSLSHDLGILEEEYAPLSTEILSLVIQHGKWNSDVNAYRQKYSKTQKSLDEVKASTKNLINSVLWFFPLKFELGNLIQSSIEKINTRKDLYKPKIHLEEFIDGYKDFPKKWIHFRDVSPLLKHPEAFEYACFELANAFQNADVIAGLDARGFLFWPYIAKLLKKPFVMIRKAWKLPGETHRISYGLEYGKDEIEIQKSSILSGQKVALVDDLLATWGTIQAAIDLVEKQGGIIEKLGFIISLDSEDLVWGAKREKLKKYPTHALISYNN